MAKKKNEEELSQEDLQKLQKLIHEVFDDFGNNMSGNTNNMSGMIDDFGNNMSGRINNMSMRIDDFGNNMSGMMSGMISEMMSERSSMINEFITELRDVKQEVAKTTASPCRGGLLESFSIASAIREKS